jgi:HSP20 family protein
MRTTVATQSHEDLGHLARHMTHLMHKILHSGAPPPGEKPADWAPAIDVCEADDHYEVIVELAGVCRSDVEVYTERGCLTITGWRHDPTSPVKIGWHQMEIEEGQFRRRVALPKNVDDSAITARLREGLLRIHIPKTRNPDSRHQGDHGA